MIWYGEPSSQHQKKTTYLEYATGEFSDSESKSIENDGTFTITKMKEPPVINSKQRTRAIITVDATTNVYEGLRKISKEERNATKRILASYTRIYGTHVNPT